MDPRKASQNKRIIDNLHTIEIAEVFAILARK
jgi:hypothetical protein